MKFETFKAGRWQQRFQYKSFEPVPAYAFARYLKLFIS